MTNITADDLVRREVHYCVSSLVSTLASNAGLQSNSRELEELVEQALELSMPIDDWEEAATEAGWIIRGNGSVCQPMPGGRFTHDEHGAFPWNDASGWRELCEHFEIEPYAREVFEHWVVSDWLADRLAEKGEKVDKEFAGMTVWARTTTGQGIAADSVIQAIVDDLNKGA